MVSRRHAHSLGSREKILIYRECVFFFFVNTLVLIDADEKGGGGVDGYTVPIYADKRAPNA